MQDTRGDLKGEVATGMVMHGDIAAFCGQSEGDGAANSPGTTGDKSSFPTDHLHRRNMLGAADA
ncbi:hypothetical protein F183_A30930 [Bryobacterales bacterium F-183]|nr:hypothetical protein F183_A30930 [Bryobacterales bacterium F-183]